MGCAPSKSVFQSPTRSHMRAVLLVLLALPVAMGIHCRSGQYKLQDKCYACPAGYYCVSETKFACTVCATGKFAFTKCTSTTNTVCATCGTCASSKFRVSSCNATQNIVCQACATCSSGSYVQTACAATANTVCTPCASGYYCPTTTSRIACSGGYACPTGTINRQTCPIGTYSTALASACSPCPIGQYVDYTLSTVCTACDSNATTLATGSVSITQCNCNGGYWRDEYYACVPCPAGYACSNNVITPCAPGQISPALSTQCTNCSYGLYQPVSASSTCLTCPAGTTVVQYAVGTEYSDPVSRPSSESPNTNVHIIRNYLIISQGHNITQWSFYSTQAGCTVTPAIFRADVDGTNTLQGAAWFMLHLLGTPRVTTSTGVQTFDFIEGSTYHVRPAVPTGILHVNSYEFFGWYFDNQSCIPFESIPPTQTSALYAMAFPYSASGTYYQSENLAAAATRTWSVQLTYTWAYNAYATPETGASSAVQCKCPSTSRQLGDGSCTTPCAKGYYTFSDDSCSICPAGSWCARSMRFPCPSGQSAIPGSTFCSPCGGSTTMQLYLCKLLTSCHAATPQPLGNSQWSGLGNLIVDTGSSSNTPATPWYTGAPIVGMLLNYASDRPFAMLQRTVPLNNVSTMIMFWAMCSGVQCSNMELQVRWGDGTAEATTLPGGQWVLVTTPFIAASSAVLHISAQVPSLSAVIWIGDVRSLSMVPWVASPNVAMLTEVLNIPVYFSETLSNSFDMPVLYMPSATASVPVDPVFLYDAYPYVASVTTRGAGDITLSTSANDTKTWVVPDDGGLHTFSFVTSTPVQTFSITTAGPLDVTAPRLTIRTPYTECQTCLANYWCTYQWMYACPAHSQSAVGSSRQTDCYCVPGYYGNNHTLVGHTPCALCAVNHFCPGRTFMYVCPPGYKAAAGSSQCEECAAGELCEHGQVDLCPAHSQSPAGSNDINDCTCVDGWYGQPSDCIACEIGFYCIGAERFTCTDNALSLPESPSPESCFCDRGYYQSDNNMTDGGECLPCEEGFWCWTGVRNSCPPNMWSPALSNYPLNCTCVAGYELLYGLSCVQCATGTYKPTIGEDACIACSIGTYSTSLAATSAETCAPCNLGSFNALPGAFQCTLCAVGYYAPSIQSTSCLACWPGSYSSDGAVDCTLCPAGSMSSVVASASSLDCTACPVGTWSSGNASACNICGSCPYWTYPPTLSTYVLGLTAVRHNLTTEQTLLTPAGAYTILSQSGNILALVDLTTGQITPSQPVFTPAAPAIPIKSLSASADPDNYVYAIQGQYAFRINVQQLSWDVLYTTQAPTCILQDDADDNVIWIMQFDGVCALDATSTKTLHSFPLTGGSHICISPAHPTVIFATGSFGLTSLDRTSGAATPLLTDAPLSLCAFTLDGSFLILTAPTTMEVFAYSVPDSKRMRLLTHAAVTSMFVADNETITMVTQGPSIQNVTFTTRDASDCPPSRFSLYSGLQLESQCELCPAGSVCSSGSNITLCAPGTYSTVPGLRHPHQCTTCPAGYHCPGGADIIPCPLGTYTLAVGLSRSTECPLCAAGSVCPTATETVLCPINTHSDPGSSDLSQCTCDAGSVCMFARVVHMQLVLPISKADFTLELQQRYIEAIARAAHVPAANVRIVAIAEVVSSRRCVTSGSIEIHTTIYNFEGRITDLKPYLLDAGLPNHRGYQSYTKTEVFTP